VEQNPDQVLQNSADVALNFVLVRVQMTALILDALLSMSRSPFTLS
jgi:hypothetical protein